MFSLNGFSAQVLNNLSELSGQFYQVKASIWTGYVTYSKYFKKTVALERASQKTGVKLSTSQLPGAEIFKYLPDDWQKLCSPLAIKPSAASKVSSPWAVSHSSAKTFYENKHGFSRFSLLKPSIVPRFPLFASSVPWSSQKITEMNVRSLYTHSARQIQELEKKANHDTNDPVAQANYLRVIVNEDPNYVIRRYESGKYGSNDSCYREYLKALVLTDRVSDDEISQGTGNTSFSSGQSSQKVVPNGMGSETNPVVVTVNNDKRSFFKEQLWNTLRFLIGLFLIVSVLEAQLQMRMTTNQKEVQPDSSEKKVKFSDVQGVEEAKTELKEVVEFLRSPEKFTKLGGRLPSGVHLGYRLHSGKSRSRVKYAPYSRFVQAWCTCRKCAEPELKDECGAYFTEVNIFTIKELSSLLNKLQSILLVGAPGTGKTLLAKAVAGEAGVPFFFCSGAEFDEMFVGVGAARVRNLFAAAKELAPCIIFIDELDAIGGTRSVGDHQPYSRMTLNQLLVELDGFDKCEGVVVIGATNFPEILDKALIRPGRFDSRVTVPMPDVRARKSILELHLEKIQLAEDVSAELLSRGTPGFSGADLANLVNQAALKAASEGHINVTNEHLDYARDKLIMGPERKSAFIEEKNRQVVAYHEGGHALVAHFTPDALPLHKATIIPRGDALGMVAQLPEKDELSWTRRQLLAKLDVCMGGRVAEELIFGKDNITSGASSDFSQATAIAKAMVTKYAMSEKVGPIVVKDDDKLSPELQSLIENEIKCLIKESYERAKYLLQTYSTEHRRLATALLQYETLNAGEMLLVIQGKSIQ